MAAFYVEIEGESQALGPYHSDVVASIVSKIEKRRCQCRTSVKAQAATNTTKFKQFTDENVLYSHEFIDLLNSEEKRYLADRYEKYARTKALSDQWKSLVKDSIFESITK